MKKSPFFEGGKSAELMKLLNAFILCLLSFESLKIVSYLQISN